MSSLLVAGARIPFCTVVRTGHLGVLLDSDLSFEQQVSSLVRSCFLHVRALSRQRPFFTCKGANAIAVSMVLSRLDYFNSLLAGLRQIQLKRLQATQNAEARVVTRSRKMDHITPVLKHPQDKGIEHKLLSTTVRSVKENMPPYLSDLVQTYSPSRNYPPFDK